MYEIVKDEKNRLGTSFFKDIDVKIGLHHGNSLAGVINRRQYTKYDVLGKEMLKAALVVANCCDSMICISEDLVNLIKNAPSNKFTFKW
jgi:class 3 adenylate cyclase